jgi:hypothetical protein
MSCWWDLDFSVTGPEPLAEQLKENLSGLKFDDGARLFHHVKVVSSLPGFVVVHASRNYHGAAAISELIARFPDLLFHGSLHSDMGYDQYTVFEGRDGEAELQDMVISDFETRFGKPLTRVDVAEKIAKLTGSIDELEFERKELNEYLARLDAQT